MSLYISLNQTQLCLGYGVPIKKELGTKYAALKIAFPEDKFHALEALHLSDQYTITDFANLCEEDQLHLAKVNITTDKIIQVAYLANYYAEKNYLGKRDSSKDSELEELAREGIEFTVLASVNDRDRAKNLGFNHSWQRV